MIRLRFGQKWRREGSSAVDSVALSLHGMDLLVGANEEHLPEVVESWTSAWEALGRSEGELAQVSLPESRLELLLRRQSPLALELSVASLGRPARITRPGLQVDVLELRKAWVAGVSALWRDLDESGQPEVAQRVMTALERVRQVAPPLPENALRGVGYGYRSFPRAEFEMGFELWDEQERLLAHRAGGSAPLASLLVPGTVSLQLPNRMVRYAPESLFLFALELSRQGQELLTGNGHDTLALELAGLGPSLEAKGDFLPAMFQLGMDLAFAVESRNGAQRENPYLRELVERCQAGLRILKTRTPPQRNGHTEVTLPGPPPRPPGPLERHGKLRRLKFVQRYERRLNAAESATQIVPLPGGKLWVCAAQWAEQYDARGNLKVRRQSEHGVAVSASDWTLVSEGNRLLGYAGAEAGARWLQPHDGLALGPWLKEQDGLFFTHSDHRMIAAFHAQIGREAWRFSPFRPARIFTSVLGGRTLVGTDAGDLFGLSTQDGQLRYRFEAPLPFIAPPVLLGSTFVAVLNSGEHSALVCADIETGKLRWTREFGWSRASEPLVAGGRLWMAGQQGTTGMVVCLTSQGEPLLEESLPFSDERYFLLGLGRSVLVSGPRGAAVRISSRGKQEYAVPPASEAAWRKLPPRASRGVLFLPGDPLRVLDVKTGHLLTELRGGPALLALETDRRLNVYALDEGGTLKAFRLLSHFAVVA